MAGRFARIKPGARAYMRPLLWAAVVIGVCAALDWPFGDLFGVNWEKHSLWAGVLTGVLLLIAGLFGLEAFLRERDMRHWQRVASIAYKSLGISADALRRGMDRLLGADDYQQLDENPLTPTFMASLDGRLQAHAVPLKAVSGVCHLERLKLLREDEQWARLAVVGLDQLKWRHREALARWAPVMLANERLARDFRRLAELNDEVSSLQEPLRARAGIDARREYVHHAATMSEDISKRWDAVVTDTVVIHEDLMRASGRDGWTYPEARARLSEAGLAAARRRDPGFEERAAGTREATNARNRRRPRARRSRPAAGRRRPK